MATTRRKQNYRDYAAYGNLAYDLNAVEREEQRRDRKQNPRIRSIENNEIRVRRAEKVSPVAVAGFAAAAVMMVLVLFSYIQLNTVSDTVVSLKSELNTLQSENVTLTAQYQTSFDLSTVETAASAAGMTKASTGQVYYMDLSDSDSAVVYQSEKETVLSGILASMGKGVYAFVEYFR